MALITAQILGIAAVTLYLLSFQLKTRPRIVFTVCAANFLYVVQYIILGAVSGAVLDVLSTAFSFVAGKKNSPRFKKYAKLTAVAMISLIAAAGIALAIIQKSWIELLPVAGALCQTGGLWSDKEQTIRKFALAGAPFWLVYNCVAMAYGAAFGTLLTMVSAVVALIRYRRSDKEELKKATR